MKAISNVFTILSIAGLALTVGACGSNNNSTPPPAAGVAAIGTGCVYTQVGILPQGSCPAGQGQIITAGPGYTVGQCLPQTAANGTGGYPNTGTYPGGYNPGYGYGNSGYGNTGYGNLGYGGAASPYAGGQCAGQTGVNGINNGQCIQTPSLGCLSQCIVPGSNLPGLLFEGQCAPATTFGVYNNGGIPGAYGPYAPGYYPPGYIPGGGGNFGGWYGFRTW